MKRRQFLVTSFSLMALPPSLFASTRPQSFTPEVNHVVRDTLTFEHSDTQGFTYIIDSENYRIRQLKDNQPTWTLEGFDENGPKLNYPTQLVENQNRLFIIDKTINTIKYIHPQHPTLHQITLKTDDDVMIHDILPTNNGTLYITDAMHHRVLHVKMDGTILQAIGNLGGKQGELNFPRKLQQDPWGNIHVLERGNNRISLIKNNTVVAMYGGTGNKRGAFSQLSDFSIDKQGNVYTLDRSSHELQCFAPNGSVNALNVFENLPQSGLPQYMTLDHHDQVHIHTLLSSKEA